MYSMRYNHEEGLWNILDGNRPVIVEVDLSGLEEKALQEILDFANKGKHGPDATEDPAAYQPFDGE